jgi:hypothetical protein
MDAIRPYPRHANIPRRGRAWPGKFGVPQGVCNERGHCWHQHYYGDGYYHPHYWRWHHWHPHYYGGWGYGGRHHWHRYDYWDQQ